MGGGSRMSVNWRASRQASCRNGRRRMHERGSTSTGGLEGGRPRRKIAHGVSGQLVLHTRSALRPASHDQALLFIAHEAYKSGPSGELMPSPYKLAWLRRWIGHRRRESIG